METPLFLPAPDQYFMCIPSGSGIRFCKHSPMPFSHSIGLIFIPVSCSPVSADGSSIHRTDMLCQQTGKR